MTELICLLNSMGIELQDMIYKGNYSNVYNALVNELGICRNRVIKIYSTENINGNINDPWKLTLSEKVKLEIQVLKKLNPLGMSKYFPHLKSHKILSREGYDFYGILVFEKYLNLNDLNIDMGDQILARKFLTQSSLALQILHSTGYLHRDIKLSNFLADHRGNFRLSDFGEVVKYNHLSHNEGIFCNEKCSTLYYTSKDVYENSIYSYHSDLYALGICVLKLLVEDISRDEPLTILSDLDIRDRELKYILEKLLSTGNRGYIHSDELVEDAVKKLTMKKPAKFFFASSYF